MENLEILYQDRDLLIINKPSGLLVHKSDLDPSERSSAMLLLRDQIGQWVFPVHRLDKPTSGCLLFSLNREITPKLNTLFENRKVIKSYHAIVRGHTLDSETIDYPLIKEWDKRSPNNTKNQKQEAISSYLTIEKSVSEIASRRYPQTRYSYLELKPTTGRKHQLRRHLAHIRHPIIGDTRHGDGEYNRLFREYYDCYRLLLHAYSIEFEHPRTKKILKCVSPMDKKMSQIKKDLFETH